jgi:ATP-dependent DNA ligase
LIPPAALFKDSPEGPSKVSTSNLFSLEPMLCEGVERPPEGREWRYELKLDGYRAIGRKSGRSTQLWSRQSERFRAPLSSYRENDRGPAARHHN